MTSSLAYWIRRWWTVGRWAGVASVLPLLWACNARTLERPTPHISITTQNSFNASVNRQIDILFMVDNSNSMKDLQNKLLDKDIGFPVFMKVLKNIPAADGSDAKGLPDVHIAVISSSVGAGGLLTADAPGGCPRWGDEGRFQTAPRDPCAVSPLLDGQHFLAASNNQAQKNYNGDISDAFTCIARLGEGGCGFEGQLKSVRWALDPSAAPPENNGFLREDAYLAVILITNEDDCSLPDDSDFATPSQELVSDPLGPLLYRCNEYGHLCNINGTLQSPPRAAISGLTECVSNDTPTGRLTKVQEEVAFLKGLKTDPRQILVAAITGPSMPYDVEMISQKLVRGGEELQPAVKHSCLQSSGEYADPSIRIRQWVEAFGDHGLLLSICAPSFEPALTQIANALSTLLEPACVEGTIQTRAGNVPNCAVSDRFKNDQGKVIETPVSACAENGNTPPCWSLNDGTDKCAGKKMLNVNRGPGAEIATSLNTDISCAICTPGLVPQDPGCPP